MERLRATYIRHCMMCLLLFAPVFVCAEPATSAHATAAASTGAESASATRGMPSLPASDDPVTVRNSLFKRLLDTTPDSDSLKQRLREWILAPIDRSIRAPAMSDADLTRDFVFILPVSHGITYRPGTHGLDVDVALSSDQHPDEILLRRIVKGPNGRGLVIAPEAVSKGYVQFIDQIEIDAAHKTRVRGHAVVPPHEIAEAEGKFAIVLVCNLTPPYLTGRREHDAPNDDEPTDITTRTSTIHASIRSAWLIDEASGAALVKGLRLEK